MEIKGRHRALICFLRFPGSEARARRRRPRTRLVDRPPQSGRGDGSAHGEKKRPRRISASGADLSFLSNVPSTRLSHVCACVLACACECEWVRECVYISDVHQPVYRRPRFSPPRVSPRNTATMVKLAKVRAPGSVCLMVSTPPSPLTPHHQHHRTRPF